MKFFAKSFTSLFLAAWILFGSLGISWTEATCIYTGSKKIALASADSCCNKPSKAHISRAKCCLLDKYQVKFSFDLTKGNKSIVLTFVPFTSNLPFSYPHVFNQYLDYFSDLSHAPPLPQQIRLARLQSYLI